MTAAPVVKWSPQQEAAIAAVSEWLADKDAPQIFRMFGYAGTGKTTLAKAMAENVKGDVRYACYTGKAALVLRKKGCPEASTIHSLIYRTEDKGSENPQFVLNPDSPLADAALGVIDEVSMVADEQAIDLLSFGKRILVLGDPAQLPPVKGEGYFINADPDVMLTEVHRQAAENPIIRMSMDVREGRRLQIGRYGESQVIRRAEVPKDRMRDLIMGADQLLCGTNKTRQAFNARIREIHGRQGVKAQHHPVPGDRVVCLRNNHKNRLLNGGLWEVCAVTVGKKGLDIEIKSLDEPGAPKVCTTVPEEFFLGTEKSLTWDQLKGKDQFTYGYALTAHKAQGSQFDNLVVFDESRVFRDDAAKWLYTAVTRAAERITVVV
jgi:exodeoxyribonuclease-5